MKLNQIAFVLLCTTTLACAERDVAIHIADARGCWATATGARSFWRPRAWLKQPDTKQTVNFLLTSTNERRRLVGDWVLMLEGAPNRSAGGYSNWQYTSSNILQLRVFDVDWSYAMDLSTISADSIRGYVRFSGDTKNGTSRIVGSRIACPPLVDSVSASSQRPTKQ